MPLALIVDSLETVPEALRGAYVADGDKFKLDAEIEDTTALKSTMQKERDRANALDKKIKAWEKSGKTPDEIAEMVSAAETAATEAAKKAGNFDGILKQHQDKWGIERTTLAGERDSALSVARSAVVDAGILSALSQNKATAEGSVLLPRILGDRVKTEFVNGKFISRIVQVDGETPMIGSAADGSATYGDLVKEAVKTFPSLFEGTGAGGGGTPTKGGGGSGAKTMANAEFQALSPKERAAKMAEPGFKLT